MNTEPKIGANLARNTTQLNLWMIVAIVFFFIVGGIFVARFLRHPPDSTEKMNHGLFHRRGVWTKAVC